MRNVSDKFVENTKPHTLHKTIFFPRKSCR